MAVLIEGKAEGKSPYRSRWTGFYSGSSLRRWLMSVDGEMLARVRIRLPRCSCRALLVKFDTTLCLHHHLDEIPFLPPRNGGHAVKRRTMTLDCVPTSVCRASLTVREENHTNRCAHANIRDATSPIVLRRAPVPVFPRDGVALVFGKYAFVNAPFRSPVFASLPTNHRMLIP